MVETLSANVSLEKTRIVSILRAKGPSVANAVSKALNLPNILTSAILSEMIAEKLVKSSYLKVGGSPLYYLQGQEIALENFLNYIELKEREAFSLLKEKGILVDQDLEPAIRVALRNIKDYAIPFKVNVNNEDKLIWKYFLLKKEDAEIRINELFKIKELKDKLEKKEVKKEELKVESKPEIKPDKEKKSEKKEEKPEKAEIKDVREKKKKTSGDMKSLAEKWLSKNSGELKQELLVKNKEASFIISLQSAIGKLDFLLVIKDKKSPNESDLAIAYHEGMNKKLPVILLFKGKLSKKLLEYASTFGGYLILKEFD